MNAEIVLSEIEEKEFTEFLHQKIKDFNNEISPCHKASREPGTVKPLNFMLKDEVGKTVGGLTANTYWDWLAIEDLYVPEEFRGMGIGKTLLLKAENAAGARGCKRCFLTTFKFQARSFYDKQGYYVIGKLDDYPPGSVYYWMRKDL